MAFLQFALLKKSFSDMMAMVMNKVQYVEDKIVQIEQDVQMDIIDDVENEGSYAGYHIDTSAATLPAVASQINPNERALNQFESEIIEFSHYDLKPVTFFEKHNEVCDVRVYRDRCCLCAKIKVRDNVIIQDLLDEISPDVERLKIKGWDYQYTRFDSIALNFSRFENLVALSCNEISNLTRLIDLPESLLELDCSCTGIRDLDELPSELRVLTCSCTNITEIDNLPRNLKSLICSHNDIEWLDHLPNNLRMLDCSSNQLQELCHLPAGLLHLKCQKNNIALIDNIPSNLSLMDVSGNPIIHLRNLPESLTFFYCRDCNRLAHIGNIPFELQTLWCEGTGLRGLDLSTCANLQRFICDRRLLRHVVFNNESNFIYHYYNFNDRAVSMVFRDSGQKTDGKFLECDGH